MDNYHCSVCGKAFTPNEAVGTCLCMPSHGEYHPLCSPHKIEKEDVIAMLEEIATWDPPQAGAGRELGALAGVGMYMQYDADKQKHEKQIRDIIEKLKK